jgi:hypothetical protein
MVLKLPTIDGFQPFPNSIMVPFMGYQSAILAYNFGIDYEMGKRTVKSLPNELFNAIRAGDTDPINVTYRGTEYTMPKFEYIEFLKRQHAQEQLTLFREGLPDAKSLMNDIITFGVDIEKLKIPANVEVAKYFIDFIATLANDSLARVLESVLGLPEGSLSSNPPPDPDPEPEPIDTLSIKFNWLDDCTGQSQLYDAGTWNADVHASNADTMYTAYKQDILAGASECHNNSNYNRFMTYVESIETGFTNFVYPYDTTKRH